MNPTFFSYGGQRRPRNRQEWDGSPHFVGYSNGTQERKSFLNPQAGHRNELLFRCKESGQIFVAATETWLLFLHKALGSACLMRLPGLTARGPICGLVILSRPIGV
jgi:hypothetical protein